MLQLFINKSTDIFFAALKAFGLAEFLFQSVGVDVAIEIEDIGKSFRVSVHLQCDLEGKIVIESIKKNGIPNLLPAIMPVQKLSKSQSYDRDKEKYLPDDYQGSILYLDTDDNKIIEQHKSDPKYPIWRYIAKSHGRGNAMEKVYPTLISLWHIHVILPEAQIMLLETVLKLFSGGKTEIAEEYWLNAVRPHLNFSEIHLSKWENTDTRLSALSLVSPSTISGNETSSAHNGIQIHVPQIFWLELYFAFVGFSIMALPFEPDNDELLLGYPKFEKLDFVAYRVFVEAYRDSNMYRTIWQKSTELSPSQTEILAFLSLSVAQIDQVFPTELQFETTFLRYKKIKMHYPFGESIFSFDLGLSKALSNPKILRALIDVSFSLSEKNQILIRRFYDAITNNKFFDWLEFFLLYQTSFGSRLPWEMVYTILFNTGDVHMTPKRNYADIFKNRGFRRIAKAIYFATLRAEYLKSQGRETVLKPIYNLKNDLLQSASDKDLFLEVVWGFVSDFQEITRRSYSKEYFPRVPAASLVDITDLVTEFGSRLVAHALLATAFSLRGKKKDNAIEEENKD